jgi:hypothetical protein
MGYSAGERIYEELFDMIDREADGSDSLEVSESCLSGQRGGGVLGGGRAREGISMREIEVDGKEDSWLWAGEEEGTMLERRKFRLGGRRGDAKEED